LIGVTTVAVAAVALAGGLIASNMGFKLNKTLIASTQAAPEGGTSLDGTNSLALPSFRQTGLATASGLRTDVGVSAGPVSKLLRGANNTLHTYTGVRGSPADFNLEAGVGYYVKVNGIVNVPYIIVGSDDPATPVSLIASTQPTPEGGSSLDGTNSYAYKYHAVAGTASALRTNLGVNAGPVSKLLRGANNTLHTYTGVRGSPADFNLVPGESYLVKVNGTVNVSYNADHY
jgi:hypothetical protein